MKIVRWWYGWDCFGFAFYLDPQQNPTLGLSKANGWGLFIGRRSIQFGRRV
jgi:hypothetical protein